MKKLLISLVLLIWSASNCAYSQNTQTRTPGSFRGLNAGGSFTVILVKADQESIKLEGDPEALANIKTEVDGGILEIRYLYERNNQGRGWDLESVKSLDGSYWDNNNRGKVRITVYYRQLNEIAQSGSGKILSEESFGGQRLALKVSGSGNLKVQGVECQYLETTVSGSGKLLVASGKVDRVVAKVSGSGNLDLSKLAADKVTARVSGSGDMEIYAISTLEARVSGSGSIYYFGSPQLDTQVSGSGRVRAKQTGR